MRRGDTNHKLLEAAAPFIESGTALLVKVALAGKGDDALTALRGIMAEVAEAEGEREPMSEDPNMGKGSVSTVRRRAKRGATDMRDSAYADMAAEMEGAWEHPWEHRTGATDAKAKATLDSTVKDAPTAYEAMVERLSNAWQEG